MVINILSCQEKGMRMMKREIFNKEKVTGFDTICVANKTIVVFFEEDGYADLVESKHAIKNT